MEQDLTRGSVLKNVVRFSLPYLLSYFLQTLYGMADLFIVGQYAGVEATTAVSVSSQVMHMLTVMIVGLRDGHDGIHRAGRGRKGSCARRRCDRQHRDAFHVPVRAADGAAAPAARAGSICAGISGTASLRASSSASAAISAPSAAPDCRSCTISFPSCSSAFRGPTPPRGCFRRRFCRWGLQTRQGRCFLFSCASARI